MRLWKHDKPAEVYANNPELTSEQATQALERARGTSSEVVYTMLDGAIPQLHRTIDAYRFKGIPPEEVEKSLAEVIGLVRSVIAR